MTRAVTGLRKAKPNLESSRSTPLPSAPHPDPLPTGRGENRDGLRGDGGGGGRELSDLTLTLCRRGEGKIGEFSLNTTAKRPSP